MASTNPKGNKAAWLEAKQQSPLVVREAPYNRPGPGQVAIKVAYAALNPADWKIIKWGHRVTEFPNILGQDASGTVVEVGEGVTHVKEGDKVLAHLLGVVSQDPAQGAFQLYATARAEAVCLVPAGVTLTQAAVLPLAVSTSIVGLFGKNQLGLSLPELNAITKNKTVLIWGGASSVGTISIQLAHLAGYTVATTASPRNFERVKALGADLIFDYNSANVVEEILQALQGENVVGAFNPIGGEPSGNAILQILGALDIPSQHKHMATVPKSPQHVPEGVTIRELGSAGAIFDDERREIALSVWQDFLPKALASGALKALPEALLFEGGLEDVQNGLNKLEAGVSAQKVVIGIGGEGSG